MRESRIWAVDQVAAVNLERALGLTLSDEQRDLAGRLLADHRASAFDLAVSRIRSSILRRIHQTALAGHSHRSVEWSDGCRSAEHVVQTATASDLLEVDSAQSQSKGQILRVLIREGKRKVAAAAQG